MRKNLHAQAFTLIDGIGVSETVVQTVGDDRIVVQIPGVSGAG